MGSPRTKLPIGVQVNQVVRLFSAPCNGKWSLAVETALPAIGEGLIMLLTPDPKQILQNYLRPKGSRAGGRFINVLSRRPFASATQRKYRTFGGGFPDVDELIGDSLPGRRFFSGRAIGGLEKWLWTGIEFSDTVGFYWLLADVLSNGLIVWSSNLFHSPICHPNTDVAGSWKNHGSGLGFPYTWTTGGESYLHDEKNTTFDALSFFHATDNESHRGLYINCFASFRGQGIAGIGPWRCRVFDGVVEVADMLDGSAEFLSAFEEGDLQCEGHFEYEGSWSRAQITIGESSGSGFRNDMSEVEGQIFGGY